MAEILLQQALLNIVWSRQLISEADLQNICDKLCDVHSIPKNPLNDVVEAINKSLSGMGFEVRRGTSESDAKSFFAICNTKADASSRLATFFTPIELRFFKTAIHTIMTHQPSGEAPLSLVIKTCLSDGDTKKKMREDDATALLERLCREKWLSAPQDDILSIGPRSLLELRQYIEGEYEEHIAECTMCSDVVFKGETCVNAACPTKMHHHCARTWFRGKPRKCVTCTNPWQDAPPGWEDTEPLPPARVFHPNAVALD